MKTLSSTPRMDSAFNQPTSTTPRMNWQLDQCYREGCKLERNLAEEQNLLKQCLSAMPVGYIPTHTAENLPERIGDLAKALAEETTEREKLERELAAVTEQRDRLAEEFDALKQSILDLSHPNMKLLLEERNEAREQRDRLAVALDVCLREMLDVIYACNEEIVDANDTFHQAIKLGQKTLDDVKGGSDEISNS